MVSQALRIKIAYQSTKEEEKEEEEEKIPGIGRYFFSASMEISMGK